MRSAALRMWGSSKPLVSCLMVTQAKRWQEGPPPGFKSFVVQSYEPRELVMVTKDPCDAMAEAAQAFPDYVRFYDVSDEPPGTLGELRQVSVEMAGGEFVATWDDDDVSASDRLEEQVKMLVGLPLADAVALARMRVQDEVMGRRFVSPHFICEPTMLARRFSMPKYPHMDVGEDCVVLESFRRLGLLDRPELYTYRIHGGGNAAGAPFAREWWAFKTGGDWTVTP